VHINYSIWGWVWASNNDPAQGLHTLKSGPGNGDEYGKKLLKTRSRIISYKFSVRGRRKAPSSGDLPQSPLRFAITYGRSSLRRGGKYIASAATNSPEIRGAGHVWQFGVIPRQFYCCGRTSDFRRYCCRECSFSTESATGLHTGGICRTDDELQRCPAVNAMMHNVQSARSGRSDTRGDSDVVLFHIYAGWFLPRDLVGNNSQKRLSLRWRFNALCW